MALLVLDEQIAGKTLVTALVARGLSVKTLGDYGVTGRPDPDVVRRVEERETGTWVLVTMDLTIVEEHPGFDWDDYAIAWVVVHEHLRGSKFEEAKHDIIQRYAHDIVRQARGDHHSYSAQRRSRQRPSLSSQLRRQL